ncbi:MAG: Exodeoxyribonuclease 7 large subunit [Pseudomonadota bacterium]
MQHGTARKNEALEFEALVWEVGALALALADVLAVRFNPVRVRGEIASFTQAASGHCYFTLKDAQGQLRCALFRRQATSVRFQPKEGDLVELEGRLDVYAPRGDLQLLVETLTLAGGQGQWLMQFVQTKAKLQTLGLFDRQKKRLLPSYPQAIGVMTSLGAAALHDVVSTLRRRTPHIPVFIFPAAVQGTQASQELRSAFRQLQWHQQHSSLPCDVLLLVRGGGSMEDLWAFNDEQLAYAITECPIPVVTGIGHETDFTIADFVADLRAPTPTAAAELCAPAFQTLQLDVQRHEQHLHQTLQQNTDRQAQRLDRCTSFLSRLGERLSQETQRLNRLEYQLTQVTFNVRQVKVTKFNRLEAELAQGLIQHLKRKHEQLAFHDQALQTLNPRRVLERGYAWLTDEQGQMLTHVHAIAKDMEIKATLIDGEVALRAI